LNSWQRAFLENEFLTLTTNGALQRSSTYRSDLDAKEKSQAAKTMRSALGTALREISSRYSQIVTEEQHTRNIEEFRRRVQETCRSFLRDGRLRFGVAQKALNLYLKYAWCVGWIVRPPHCPFDRRLIQDILQFRNDDWTKVDDQQTYIKWVKRAEEMRIAANDESIADWELRIWNASRR